MANRALKKNKQLGEAEVWKQKITNFNERNNLNLTLARSKLKKENN